MYQLTMFEHLCEKDSHVLGQQITTPYPMILSKLFPGPPSYDSKWETDLGATVEPEDWTDICSAGIINPNNIHHV